MPTTLAAGLKSLAGRHSAVDWLPPVPTNINGMERVVSAALGASLISLPVRGLPGLLAKFAGGALLFRGATGHCMGYQMLGLSSAEPRTMLHDESGSGQPDSDGDGRPDVADPGAERRSPKGENL